jgi:hypothetical protein
MGSVDPGSIAFTTDTAAGAWPNGTRVQKRNSKADDGHADGALGTVLGSIGAGGLLGYFVAWDDRPGLPVFVAGPRLVTAAPGGRQ